MARGCLSVRPNKKQPLTTADITWLKFAQLNDVRITMKRSNPKLKGGASRERYESYKRAKTLKDFLLRGGTKGDLKWDYIHGFIDFDEIDSESQLIKTM